MFDGQIEHGTVNHAAVPREHRPTSTSWTRRSSVGPRTTSEPVKSVWIAWALTEIPPRATAASSRGIPRSDVAWQGPDHADARADLVVQRRSGT
jgi:hypothetical protein